MKLPWFLIPALALLALTGGGTELADVELVETLCVDGARPVTVTALGQEGTYTAQGDTLPAAQAGLAGQGEKRLEVTHIRQLVLGAQADIPALLGQEAVHRQSGSGATVWLYDGAASSLPEETEEDIPRRLHTLEDGGVGAPVLLEAVTRLSQGEPVRLPVVKVEEGKLLPAGYRTVKGGGGVD